MQSTLSHQPAQPFWDQIAPKYARKPVDDPAAYEEKLAQVGALLRDTDRVLEIGCGTGSTALRLASGVAHYTATDGSRGMIEIAQSKLEPTAPTNITFKHADAAALVEGHPFDAVCAFSLLHLIEDIPQALKRINAQLKPDGLFISKTVCIDDTWRLMRVIVRGLTAIGFAPRVTVLSRTSLIAHLRAAGFKVEQVTYFDKKHMSPFIVARRSDD